MSIFAAITTQKGQYFKTWTQELSVINIGRFTNYGLTQETTHRTTGKDIAMSCKGDWITGPMETFYSSNYTYPLYANTSFSVEPTSGNLTLDATLVQGLDLDIRLDSETSLFPRSASSLSTRLEGRAHYFGSPQAKMSTGYGGTNQTFGYETTGEDAAKYFRDVRAVNGSVVKDIKKVNGVEKVTCISFTSSLDANDYSQSPPRNPRQAIGRGPGTAKEILISGGWSD